MAVNLESVQLSFKAVYAKTGAHQKLFGSLDKCYISVKYSLGCFTQSCNFYCVNMDSCPKIAHSDNSNIPMENVFNPWVTHKALTRYTLHIKHWFESLRFYFFKGVGCRYLTWSKPSRVNRYSINHFKRTVRAICIAVIWKVKLQTHRCLGSLPNV